MKKTLLYLLMVAILVMAPVMAACNGESETPTTTSQPPTTTSQPPTTTSQPPTTTSQPPTTTSQPPTTTSQPPTTTSQPPTTTSQPPTTTSQPPTTTTSSGEAPVPSAANHPGQTDDSLCAMCHPAPYAYPDDHEGRTSGCLAAGCHQLEGAATTQPPTTTAGGDSLSDILGYSANITSVKYDMIVTSPDMGEMATTFWIKGNKMRSETVAEGQTIIMILDMDAQKMYVYYPDQDMAVEMGYEPGESAIDEAQAIAGYSPTIIGTETIDGKVCLVVEYSVEGSTVKMWLWEEYGFPIRIETTTSEGMIIAEYRNIEFGDIPDSMFELPEGVEPMSFGM